MGRVISISLLATDRMSRAMDSAAKSTKSLGDHLEAVDKIGRAGGMAVAAGGAVALANAAVPALAAVGAMPAVLTAVKVASGTLKVGLMGVSDAMKAVGEGDAKKVDAALKKLAPSAAAVVKETQSLQKSWTGLQRAVQEKLFSGLAGQMQGLAANVLPAVRSGMTGVAGALNGLAREAARSAQTPWFRGEVAKVFQGTAGMANVLRGAVEPLARSVLILVNAAFPLVTRMAGWAVQGAKAAAAFLVAKQESGALAGVITKIGDTFQTLGRIGGNLALTIGRVVGQSREFGNVGGNLLSTLDQLTARAAAWSASLRGQQQAAAVFGTLGDSARQAAVVLPVFGGALSIVAKILTSLPAGTRAVVSQMLAWSIVVNVLVTRLKLLAVASAAFKAASAGAAGAAAAFRGLAAAQVAVSGFAAGLRNANLAFAAGASQATVLGAALRSQILLWNQQAAAAGVSTARIIVQAAVQKAVAAATRVWAAAQWLLNAALSANPIGIVIGVLVALVAAVVIAYKKSETFRNIVNGAWAAIKQGIAVAWAAIKPVFSAIARVVGVVLKIAFVVLKNTIKAAWIAIQIAVKLAWAFLKPQFQAIKAFVSNVLGPVFRWLWHNVIVPVFNGIKSHISSVWNNGIKPVFNVLKGAVGKVRDAFKTAVDGIKTHWDKIKEIAKKPVNFVIGVYNRGIVDLVNKIAGFAGIKTRLGHIATLASGGTLADPAKARPMMTKGPMAIVGEGRKQYPEFVIPTDPKYRGRAQALWASAGHALTGGRWNRGRDRLGGEGIALAGGGIVGGFLDKLKGFSFLDPEKAFKSALGKLVGNVPGSGVFRDVIAGVPAKVVSWLVSWFKSKVGFGSGAGGPGVSRGLAFAKAQNGKPYVWGGVGPGGYDCSGLWSAIVNVIHGRNPYSRLFSTMSFGNSGGPGGFVRNLNSAVKVGVTNAGVGHMAGTIGRTNIESSGSRGVHLGPSARGFNDPLFGYRYGLKADTGALELRPGWNPPTYNGTGGKELLTTRQASGGNTYNLHFADDRNMYEKGKEFARGLEEYKRRGGRIPTP